MGTKVDRKEHCGTEELSMRVIVIEVEIPPKSKQNKSII